MQVLLITATYPTKTRPSAGIFVRNQFQLLKRKAERGERIDLFCVYTRLWSHKRSFFKVAMAALRFVPRLFRRYDVLHVHFLSPLLFAAIIYQNIRPATRLVLTIHGSGLRRIADAPERRLRRYRKAVARFDELIVVGPALVPQARKILDREPDQVLCAGVDDLHFFREAIDAKEYDFIFVGNFDKPRGLDLMIEALERINDLEAKACFVGSGPLTKALQRAAHNLPIDVFRDVPQRRLRHLYNKARFLVFPARADGFGLVVSEAMYCGTPAIVYADSGAQHQVRHNENGLIYKPNTPEKLARALADALSLDAEHYESLSIGAQNANQEFTLDKVCTTLLHLYRSLANGEKRVRNA